MRQADDTQEFPFSLNLKNAEKVLQYGAALGSILGGFSMLFKQRQQQIKV